MILFKLTHYTYLQDNMDDSIYHPIRFEVNMRLPTEMIPWKVYDSLYRMYEHTTGPFLIEGLTKIKRDIAWHSNFQVVYPHTRNFRLMRAITENDLPEVEKVVKEIRRSGTSIDSVIDKKYGLNAMQFAAVSNKFPVIEFLLLNGANPDSKNKFGFTPLMFAVMHNNLETVHTLTKSGCDINAKDKYGQTAIDKAKSRSMMHLYDYLTEQSKKNITRNFPVFTLRMPSISSYLDSKAWKILDSHKIYTGKVVLSPFNTLRGIYSVSFTNYRTVGRLGS